MTVLSDIAEFWTSRMDAEADPDEVWAEIQERWPEASRRDLVAGVLSGASAMMLDAAEDLAEIDALLAECLGTSKKNGQP